MNKSFKGLMEQSRDTEMKWFVYPARACVYAAVSCVIWRFIAWPIILAMSGNHLNPRDISSLLVIAFLIGVWLAPKVTGHICLAWLVLLNSFLVYFAANGNLMALGIVISVTLLTVGIELAVKKVGGK